MLRRTIAPLALLVAVAACNDNETPPPAHGAYTGTAPAALPCVPNLDGKIEARELAPFIGTTATYLVSPPGKERNVDLAGQQRDGKLVWSLAIDFADPDRPRLAFKVVHADSEKMLLART